MDTEADSNMEVEESEPRHSELNESNSSEYVAADTQEQENDNNGSTTEPSTDAVNSSSTDNNVVIRDKCAYGQNCYRKNLQHKMKFSHPGDPDFDEVDTRPECPYGIQCYRKNPQHKRDYQHTQRRPRRQVAASGVHFADYFSSDEESVDESDYDPTELGLDYDDDDDEMSDENFIDDEAE